jgi:hypothetical protein
MVSALMRCVREFTLSQSLRDLASSSLGMKLIRSLHAGVPCSHHLCNRLRTASAGIQSLIHHYPVWASRQKSRRLLHSF